MNFNYKNKYIKLPTNEPEIISQVISQSYNKKQEEKISSQIKRDLIIYNIIISFLITILVIPISIELTNKKWDKKSYLKPQLYDKIMRIKDHQKYIKTAIDGILTYKPKMTNSLTPKISIIISVYNKEKYILRILRSIQNQNFDNIEIIFADDSSKDNSIQLIEKYQEEDPRIKLVKHDYNVGTLINRNDGALNAKGEYLLFLDCDDLLLDNILNLTYYTAKKDDLDIIQFRAYWGKYLLNVYKYEYYGYIHNSTILYQPELSNLMYYEYPDKILQTEYNLWGKLIKRSVFLEIFKKIDKYYLEQHMTLHEDGMIIFILFQIAKSYLFLDEMGMFYYTNEDSSLAGLRKDKNIDKTVRDSFLYLKFMYEYTGENKKEKDMAVYQFKYILQQFEKIFYKIKTGFNFIYEVIEMYLDCEYIDQNDMQTIRNVLYNFENHEKEMKSNK